MTAYPKKLEGLCIGVLSADRILFQGPPDRENGGFKQKILYLSGVQAPKFDHQNSREEQYSFQAREFMRNRLVGTLESMQAGNCGSSSKKKLTKWKSVMSLMMEKT